MLYHVNGIPLSRRKRNTAALTALSISLALFTSGGGAGSRAEAVKLLVSPEEARVDYSLAAASGRPQAHGFYAMNTEAADLLTSSHL
ncbi:hypothetical protein D3C74_483690 [compost metagenome]